MTDNIEKKVAVDGPVATRASMARPVFPRPGFTGRPAGGLASGGRWRASVRLSCGFCVASRWN